MTLWKPVCLIFCSALVFAQENPAARAARSWREAHEHAILREYFDLLSIPNIASDKPNIRRNAEFIQKMFERRGVQGRGTGLGGGP